MDLNDNYLILRFLGEVAPVHQPEWIFDETLPPMEMIGTMKCGRHALIGEIPDIYRLGSEQYERLMEFRRRDHKAIRSYATSKKSLRFSNEHKRPEVYARKGVSV